LEPIFCILLEDVCEVKDGVFNNIPEFIRSVPVSERDKLALKLSNQILAKENQWRKRVERCDLLEKIASVISSELFCQSFIGYLMELCMDEAASVRTAASTTIGNVLVILKDKKEFSSTLEFVIDM